MKKKKLKIPFITKTFVGIEGCLRQEPTEEHPEGLPLTIEFRPPRSEVVVNMKTFTTMISRHNDLLVNTVMESKNTKEVQERIQKEALEHLAENLTEMTYQTFVDLSAHGVELMRTYAALCYYEGDKTKARIVWTNTAEEAIQKNDNLLESDEEYDVFHLHEDFFGEDETQFVTATLTGFDVSKIVNVELISKGGETSVVTADKTGDISRNIRSVPSKLRSASQD